VAFFILIAAGCFAAQSTWVGQLLTQGHVKEDPMDKLTPAQARQMIEQGLTDGLKAVGAPVKIAYTAGGQPAKSDVDGPVNMSVDTDLKEPSAHKAIVDAIKPYMEKALVPVLEMHDSKSRATWTYTVQLPSPSVAQDSDPLAAPATSAAQSGGGAPVSSQ
jgi:hypothetical protein